MVRLAFNWNRCVGIARACGVVGTRAFDSRAWETNTGTVAPRRAPLSWRARSTFHDYPFRDALVRPMDEFGVWLQTHSGLRSLRVEVEAGSDGVGDRRVLFVVGG